LTKPAPKNLPASVRQKLANLARRRNVDFGLILVKYGLERILFRLSRSRRCVALLGEEPGECHGKRFFTSEHLITLNQSDASFRN